MGEVVSFGRGKAPPAARSEPPRPKPVVLRSPPPSPELPKQGRMVKVLDEAALREAVVLVRRLGQDETLVDPRAAMLQLVHNSFLMCQAAEAMVRGLEERNLEGIGKYIDVRLADGETIRVPDSQGQLAEARLRLLGDWMDRAARISSLAIRAGLEARLVELAEQQARQMATLLQRFVKNLGSALDLTPDQQAKALDLIVNEVRLLGTEVAAKP